MPFHSGPTRSQTLSTGQPLGKSFGLYTQTLAFCRTSSGLRFASGTPSARSAGIQVWTTFCGSSSPTRLGPSSYRVMSMVTLSACASLVIFSRVSPTLFFTPVALMPYLAVKAVATLVMSPELS